MALLYRAIWKDQRTDLVEAARPVFEDWIRSKGIDIAVPEVGTATDGGTTVALDQASDEDTNALRMRLVEERPVPGGEERWTTTAHWLRDAKHGWVWVDLEWVSDDAFARTPDVVAPRLAQMMLTAPGAELGGTHLGPTPSRVSVTDVEDLVSHILDATRPLPVVVFSTDRTVGPEGYSARVRECARRLTGVADVRMLTSDSERMFDEALAPLSLSVFGGAVRIYLPNVDAEDPQPWRHRYIRSQLLSARPSVAAGRVAALVLPRMAAQRPPEAYRRHFKHLLDSNADSRSPQVSNRINELDDEVTQLQIELQAARDEREWASLEAAESERLAEDRLRHLEALRAQLRVEGKAPEVIESSVDSEDDVASCADAVERARVLEFVIVHPDAPRDIDRMDESPDAELWGRRLWGHLQALNAYAEAKGPGFQTWCETSGHQRVISPKFISMTESETVTSNERLRRCRDLPVDPAVSSSETIQMLAHIKSVQGGGRQIPRIYFHDDTKGVTGKIHIGFIGPHDLMPNTRTN